MNFESETADKVMESILSKDDYTRVQIETEAALDTYSKADVIYMK